MSNACRALWLTGLFALACTSSRGDVLTSRRTPAAAGSGPSADCNATIYCDGFEAPSDGLQALGSGTIAIVSSPVRTGTGALEVTVAGQNDWARIEVPLDALSQVGVRAWVMLAPDASDLESSDVRVLVALHPSAEFAPGSHKVSIDLEAGFQLKLIETLSPEKRHSDSALVPGTWHCLQLQIDGAVGEEQATFSLDGSARAQTETQPSVVSPGGFQSLLVGIEWSNGSTPLTLYYDDLAVSETAPPCDG